MFFATFYSIPWGDHLPKHFSCKGLLWTSVKVISTLPVKHSSKPIVLGQPAVFSWRMSPSFNMKWKGESYVPQDLTIKLEVFSHFLLLSTSCDGFICRDTHSLHVRLPVITTCCHFLFQISPFHINEIVRKL